MKTVCESLGSNKIKTPVNEQDLPKIENQFNISINLSSHSDSNIYPIRIAQSVAAKHVDLLLTSNSETNHYVWIKNFNRLCYNVTKHKAKKFFCKYCIQHFASESILLKHTEDCIVLTKCQSIELPVEGETTKFKSSRETVKIPFVIHADLESLLEKLTATTSSHSETISTTVQSTEQDKTEKLQNTLLVLMVTKLYVVTIRA